VINFNDHQIHRSQAGGCVRPRDHYNLQHLVQAITYVKSNEVRQAAQRFQEGFSNKDGCADTLQFFYKDLFTRSSHSDLEDAYAARYTIKNTALTL
jgi:hypothetical protein